MTSPAPTAFFDAIARWRGACTPAALVWQQVADARSLLAADGLRYLVGPGFVCWFDRDRLFGYAIAGTPGLAEARALVDVFETLFASPSFNPHGVLADFSRLELIDRKAFSCLLAHSKRVEPILARLAIPEAVIRPDGIVGAAVAGFYWLVGAPFPFRVHAQRHEGLAWLNRADFEPALRALDAIGAIDHALLHDLRALLLRGDIDDEAAAAKHLAVSRRTLQRHLHAADTTFRAEILAARLVRARRFLAESPDKLAVVAREVGFASEQHFCTWFKRHTGMRPSDYRST